MAESEEELKNLLMKVKEKSEKAGSMRHTLEKFSVQKTKIMASDPIISWKIDEEKMEKNDQFYFPGLQNQRGQ